MVAVIIGASGLTGSLLLSKLIEDSSFSNIISISRSSSPIKSPRLRHINIEFDKLKDLSGTFKADVAFCCLGTTMQKAQSKDHFFKVDHDYVLAYATLCKKNGVKHFLVISSIGANMEASNFYLQTKGKVEAGLSVMSFDKCTIFRPSILAGNRKETRFGEKIGLRLVKVFSFLLIGKLNKYRATDIGVLTEKMIEYAHVQSEGWLVVENNKIIGI